MKTAKHIWLLDDDEIVWCDDPDPAGLGSEAPESVEYVKAEEIESLRGLADDIRDWDITNKMETGKFWIPIDLRKRIAAAVGDPEEDE